ncbi:anaerobic benzoate catabolism transcriptional regulator [Leminorella richardii]|uniref:Anaerobic benzoate catabolism transcriptional regulator n=1 Tax=Leminorella richardii TaxID=158841 RepID=A0A2X4UZ30_9GAMM|nr:helix-turn-helix transcriptional regulator [Leminorella richardii]SQI44123.1 anaerobic benzoate catabolism transcriptional regulator [Leminorella richardii]
MDLSIKKPSEIVKLLCERLRKERITLQMTQSDVAVRAGVGVNTVSNLESGRNISFESLVRVAMVLGRSKELEALFKPKLESLDDLRRYEKNVSRQRIKKRNPHDK